MFSVTTEIHCTICQRLWGAMEDCSKVRGRQLWTLCRQRRCMSVSLHMFGSLWNAVAAHEHPRQDRRNGRLSSSRYPAMHRLWTELAISRSKSDTLTTTPPSRPYTYPYSSSLPFPSPSGIWMNRSIIAVIYLIIIIINAYTQVMLNIKMLQRHFTKLQLDVSVLRPNKVVFSSRRNDSSEVLALTDDGRALEARGAATTKGGKI